MSENYKFQASFKFGSGGHLLNVRADDIAELAQALRDLTSNAPEILAASGAFVPSAPPAPDKGAPLNATLGTPYTPPVAPSSAPPAEMQGMVEKVEVVQGTGKTGKPYTKFVVHVGGAKCGTFDGLLGKVSQSLVGKNAYFVAEKGAYGYDLKNIRPA